MNEELVTGPTLSSLLTTLGRVDNAQDWHVGYCVSQKDIQATMKDNRNYSGVTPQKRMGTVHQYCSNLGEDGYSNLGEEFMTKTRLIPVPRNSALK